MNTSIVNNNSFPVFTNDPNNVSTYIATLKPVFDTQMYSIGSSQSRRKFTNMSISIYGSGGKIRISARSDNSSDTFRLITGSALGGDVNGYIDFAGKGAIDIPFTFNEETNMQLRIETLGCTFDSIELI